MTREEMIEEIENTILLIKQNDEDWLDQRDIPILEEAIKAMEIEPCEDYISRQAALDAFGLSEKTRKYGGDHRGYDTMMLYEIQDVIEDLQSVHPDPFINKPCVSEQACHEDKVKVLEKIRTEIEQERSGYPPSADYYKAIMKCLQIIDKYKAESEGKE